MVLQELSVAFTSMTEDPLRNMLQFVGYNLQSLSVAGLDVGDPLLASVWGETSFV